jgi:hypothetical protein
MVWAFVPRLGLKVANSGHKLWASCVVIVALFRFKAAYDDRHFHCTLTST